TRVRLRRSALIFAAAASACASALALWPSPPAVPAAAPSAAATPAAPVPPLTPPTAGGVEETDRLLRRLETHRVLLVLATPRDGHGQHQASGVIAGDAFAAAGDAKAVPVLAAAGETPWSPKAFYRETGYWRGEGTTVVIPTGGTDPLTGRSFYQIAMASRS